MNYEEFREQCAKIADNSWDEHDDAEVRETCVGIVDAIHAMPLPNVTQEPVAYVCHDLDGRCGVGLTKKEAKDRAGEFCDEYLNLYLAPPSVVALEKQVVELTKENEDFRTKSEHQFQAVHQDLVIELGVKDGSSVLEVVDQLKQQVEKMKLALIDCIQTIQAFGVVYSEEGINKIKELTK